MNALFSLGYWFMPEELLMPIILLLGVIAVFLYLIGLKGTGLALLSTAFGMFFIAMLPATVIEEVLALAPWWLVVVVMVAVGFYFVRLFLTLFLGAEGAGSLMAIAVAGIFTKLLSLPRFIPKIFRQMKQLLRSSNPFKRIAGISLAILLAIVAGAATRILQQQYWHSPSTPNMAHYPQVNGSAASIVSWPE